MVHFNGEEAASKKRSADSDNDNSSRTSASDASSRHRKRKDKKAAKRQSLNGSGDGGPDAQAAIRRRDAFKTRRDSLGKAARDPRDEPPTKKPKKLPGQETPRTLSPPPVIESDGLSRPSLGTRQRLNDTPEEAKERLEKMRGAVRTILECVGEDPDREGLLDTPGRYAKALLEFTRGYQVNVESIVNGALFHEGHNEMVIIKDIEVFSLCEHHMVPFTGKVGRLFL
jgi:GTP cyclohydrolase I